MLMRETAVARSLDFVEIQNNEATAAVASIEDAAACDERADALVIGLLARVMRRRGTIATALDYVRSLARDTRANCWELAERAGHGLPYRMQGLLGRSRWRWEDLRDLLPGLAQDVLGGDPGDGIGPGLAIDETADLRKGNVDRLRGAAACRGDREGGELRECAMRRTAVSPAQRAEMRGDISGSDG